MSTPPSGPPVNPFPKPQPIPCVEAPKPLPDPQPDDLLNQPMPATYEDAFAEVMMLRGIIHQLTIKKGTP
jgi:hypothetical protein